MNFLLSNGRWRLFRLSGFANCGATGPWLCGFSRDVVKGFLCKDKDMNKAPTKHQCCSIKWSKNELASPPKIFLKAFPNTSNQQLLTTNWSLAVGWQRGPFTQRLPQFCQKRSWLCSAKAHKADRTPYLGKTASKEEIHWMLLWNLRFHHRLPLWSVLIRSYSVVRNPSLVARNLCTIIRNCVRNCNQKKQKTERDSDRAGSHHC